MTSPARTRSIKYLGTSWEKRGLRYWRLRALATAFCAFLLSLSVWAVAIILDLVLTKMHGTGRVALFAILVLGIMWSVAYGCSLTRRTPAEKALGVPPIMRSRSTNEARERAGWAGVGAGIAAGPLVVVAQIFVVGTLAALVFTSLQRYISIEEFEAATGKRVPRRNDDDYASVTIFRRRGGNSNATDGSRERSDRIRRDR